MLRIIAILAGLAAFPAYTQEVSSAQGAVLRGLDKVSGALSDIDLETGHTASLGRLEITLSDCRFPAGNPSSNAFAFLTIVDTSQTGPVFRGWMMASSPALNALDHARYDVWVLRCKTS